MNNSKTNKSGSSASETDKQRNKQLSNFSSLKPPTIPATLQAKLNLNKKMYRNSCLNIEQSSLNYRTAAAPKLDNFTK
jgi:hypothetical protein